MYHNSIVHNYLYIIYSNNNNVTSKSEVSTCTVYSIVHALFLSFSLLKVCRRDLKRLIAEQPTCTPFALILWEIGTNNVPFGGMSPMCAGLMVRV